MTFRPFTIPAAKGKSFKTIGAIDVAAKYLVYKLYEATDGQRMRWATLREDRRVTGGSASYGRLRDGLADDRRADRAFHKNIKSVPQTKIAAPAKAPRLGRGEMAAAGAVRGRDGVSEPRPSPNGQDRRSRP